MKNEDCNRNEIIRSANSLSRLTWLAAGIGIGGLAGILLAPQSGEDTREWISSKYQDGIDTVNSKVRKTSQQVGDWIDESKNQVAEAVTAGREAYVKAQS
jgi:gas vesicle protein